MPYNSRGIATAEGSKRIELSTLFKQGYIQKNNEVESGFQWSDNWGNNAGSIGIKTCFNDSEKWINLIYTVTDRNNEKFDMNYKVYLTEVESNLGIGKIYYFICPISGLKCRVLYMAYGSHYFKCRRAYRYRIYYHSQTYSKQTYALNRAVKLENIIKKLDNTRMKTVYRGMETRTYKRYMKLKQKHCYYENINYNHLCGALLKLEHRFKR